MSSWLTSPQQWVEVYLSRAKSAAPPPLIDIRPLSHFKDKHIHSATHFPGLHGVDGLLQRTNELPLPHNTSHIALIASTIEEARTAAQYLSPKGYTILPFSDTDLFPFLPTQTGYVSRPLWHPAPLLSQYLPHILHHVPRLTALDIGAGSGRDAAWLSYHGFSVTAVDRDPNLTNKSIRLANQPAYNAWFKRNQVCSDFTGTTRTFGSDLKDDASFLDKNASGLLLVVRFLRRGVFEQLWRAVLPGGFVVYEHFLTGCERFPHGPRKLSQMLSPGELRDVFSANRGFQRICETESTLSDGRPVQRFVARRLPQDTL